LIELNHSDEDVRLFKNGLMESPETGVPILLILKRSIKKT